MVTITLSNYKSFPMKITSIKYLDRFFLTDSKLILNKKKYKFSVIGFKRAIPTAILVCFGIHCGAILKLKRNALQTINFKN